MHLVIVVIKMSFLTEIPPKSLNIAGMEYPINTDFRTILRYNAKLKETEDDDTEGIINCLKMVFDKIFPEDIAGAVQSVNWFIRCGKTEKKRKPSNRLLGINSNEPFDFEVDGELIYSAFKRNDVYGIDLHETPYLHWWEFIAMLNDLPENVKLSRIMEYRTIDTTNKNLSKEARDVYAALQRYYKIQEVKSQRNEELIKALKEGRDPSPYL